MSSRSPFWKMLWVVGVSLLAAACASAPFARPRRGPEQAFVLPTDEALLRDARQYAQDVGVDLEEAARRLQVQDDIGRLNAALAENERDTFAGLWIEHQPAFQVIVLFTHDGERTMRSYVRDRPWADLVEVRRADYTLVELNAASAETALILDQLEFDVHYALDVKSNRVVIWVTDRAWFEAQLEEANLRLPERVELVKVEGPSAQEVDACAPSPVPGVAWPRQRPVEGIRATMAAELIGELALVDGCLRVGSIYGDASYLAVWPPDFALRAEDDEIQVLDESGQVVARTGQEVYMDGGEGSVESMAECVRRQLPAHCVGPYWIVGTGVRPNLKRDSELFALDVISAAQRSVFLLRKRPALDGQVVGGASIAGTLVLYDGQRCPRVRSEGGLGDYLPLWPPDYEARLEDGQFEIVDGSGQMVARAGEWVRLDGGLIPGGWESEQYRRLHHELPGDCHGPYWIVDKASLVAPVE
jgi:hypothetical protein